MNLTKEQIEEIADQIDCGFKCFIHKQTGVLTFLPDELHFGDLDDEPWAEDNSDIEENILDYFVMEPLDSHNSFQIMESFAENLDDSNRLKDRLFDALNRRKPFREFKFEIDNSGEYRQQWFDFKNEWMKAWVRKRLKDIEDSE